MQMHIILHTMFFLSIALFSYLCVVPSQSHDYYAAYYLYFEESKFYIFGLYLKFNIAPIFPNAC